MRDQHHPGRGKRGGAAFTIIELLVTIAIIILLLSILVVAVNAASRAAQRASTTALMNTMSKGLERFKNDIGYYPPVLGPTDTTLRDLFLPPAPSLAPGAYQTAIQDWYSTAAMADYLVGWDVGVNDGYGYPAQNETPPSAIRNPDFDGVWGGTLSTALPSPNGSLASRNPPLTGKVYGPYVEVSDPKLLGAVNGVDANGEKIIVFAGDVTPAIFDSLPKVICDYWGRPIRYYRRPYPAGAIGQSYRTATDLNGDGDVDQDDIVPTLSDVYLLRPWSITPGAESINRFGDQNPDIPQGSKVSSRTLDAAEFALWSSGADKSYNRNIVNDADEFNKDNVVEVGP